MADRIITADQKPFRQARVIFYNSKPGQFFVVDKMVRDCLNMVKHRYKQQKLKQPEFESLKIREGETFIICRKE